MNTALERTRAICCRLPSCITRCLPFNRRAPEGTYTIDARNPRSAFHLSLRVSYPDERDKARAESLGVPPGGDIYIHRPTERGAGGGAQDPRRSPQPDWTTGCAAVTVRGRSLLVGRDAVRRLSWRQLRPDAAAFG